MLASKKDNTMAGLSARNVDHEVPEAMQTLRLVVGAPSPGVRGAVLVSFSQEGHRTTTEGSGASPR